MPSCTGSKRGNVKSPLKGITIKIFKEGNVELHKWHSNEPELEKETEFNESGEQSYAKQQLGVDHGETKVLGLLWDKTSNVISVKFPEQPENPTKRSVLSCLASVYDPLGVVSPVTLVGKIVFRDTCEAKLTWDEQLQGKLLKHWEAWITSLPERIGVPRSLAFSREEICAIDLHGFGDASGQGTCAAVYAHVIQPSVSSQGLITSKSRLSKKGVTIPRLELISGHMTANLLENIKEALKHLPIRACYGWLDSAVALYWIQGQGSYKQFMANRIRKIRQKEFIVWKHVASKENPADIGRRGSHGSKITTYLIPRPRMVEREGPMTFRVDCKIQR